jgi:hypothetical protein
MSFRLEIREGALYELRSAPGVQAELERRARAVLEACGGEAAGYALSSGQGAKRPQGRWRTAVYTSNLNARVDNARNQTLIRNFGAASG